MHEFIGRNRASIDVLKVILCRVDSGDCFKKRDLSEARNLRMALFNVIWGRRGAYFFGSLLSSLWDHFGDHFLTRFGDHFGDTFVSRFFEVFCSVLGSVLCKIMKICSNPPKCYKCADLSVRTTARPMLLRGGNASNEQPIPASEDHRAVCGRRHFRLGGASERAVARLINEPISASEDHRAVCGTRHF